MSRFFSGRYSSLDAYVPGEQPKDKKYIKLNTNESPFPPSESVIRAVSCEASELRLYSDPESYYLTKKCAELYGVSEDMVLMTNGSDEILNFAFMAFSDESHPIVFPDITYGFYPVFAELNRIPYETIPLTEDFRVDYRDYLGIGKNIVIANPNAPTGIALPLSEIEEIVRTNPDNVVIIDEAYVDFGGESAVPLVSKYSNLIVTMTFSKSRSMAGARLGFGVGCPELIADLNTIKYSTNPYNVNSMTAAAGLGTMADEEYTLKNCKTVIENREYVTSELRALGFELTNSMTNFVFAKHPRVSGDVIYKGLRERGILVRHFGTPRICEYNRITVGSMDEMRALVETVKDILEDKK